MMAAALTLGLSCNSTGNFVKREVLRKMPGVKGMFLAPEEIERFKKHLCDGVGAVEDLGTKRSRDAIALLDSAGIKPFVSKNLNGTREWHEIVAQNLQNLPRDTSGL